MSIIISDVREGKFYRVGNEYIYIQKILKNMTGRSELIIFYEMFDIKNQHFWTLKMLEVNAVDDWLGAVECNPVQDPGLKWPSGFTPAPFMTETSKVTKCECGAEKCNSNFHSSWCPKHCSNCKQDCNPCKEIK